MPTELPGDLPHFLDQQFPTAWPVMQRYAAKLGEVPLRVGKGVKTIPEIVQWRDPEGLSTYFNWLFGHPTLGKEAARDVAYGTGAARPTAEIWGRATLSGLKNFRSPMFPPIPTGLIEQMLGKFQGPQT